MSGNSVNVTSGLVAVTSGVYLASGIVVNISGQNVTANVSVTANISGQQVYLGSGSNFVSFSGQPVWISGLATTASGLAVSTSGASVVVSSGAISVISGEIHVISGSITVGSGIGAQMSGVAVSMSGNAISAISGAVSIMSGTVSVSGFYQAGLVFESGVGKISGAVPTVLLAFDYAASTWNPLSISVSGGNILNVAANVTSTALQSGEIHIISGSVTLGSGANLVMSGLAVASGLWLASGINVVTTVSTAAITSGEIHVMSGSVTIGSGASAVLSGVSVTLASNVVTVSGNAVVASISGNVISISGDVLNMSGSSVVPSLGAPTMASGFGFSGGIGVVPAMWDFSGANWVPLSSVTSGNNSALTVAQETATKIRIGLSGTAVQSGIPNTSGGTALQSGDLYVITVRNVSGNNDMYIGGSGALPYSGFGFVLCGGDAITMSITNANLVYVYATVSGQFVKWLGSQL